MSPQFQLGAEETPGQARDKARKSIFLGAVICLAGCDTSTNVRVRNISAGGMMIDLPGPFEKGLVIAAELKGIGKISGKIAWSTENRAGIVFDRSVDPRLARQQMAPPINPHDLARMETYNKFGAAQTRRPGLAIR